MAKKFFADDVGCSYPDPVRRLIAGFCGMPGIGPRTAERMAQHVLKMRPEDAAALARAVSDVKEKVRSCPVCFNLTEGEKCSICSDPRRDGSLLCVVEQIRDLAALEASGAHRGLYHVLTGALSPLDGVGPEHLTLEALRLRVKGCSSTWGCSSVRVPSSTPWGARISQRSA